MVNDMDIYEDDIDAVAENLAALAYVIWLALDNKANVPSNELAPAAFVLSGLLDNFADRISQEQKRKVNNQGE